MSAAGYSSTPLIKKLGLKPEYKIWLINPPDDYATFLGIDPTPQLTRPNQIPDWAHLFAPNQSSFEKEMTRLNHAAFGKNPKNNKIVGESGRKSQKQISVGESGEKIPSPNNTSLIVWVSWYKKSSGIATDLHEDIIRNYALSNGWVDIKVCAVSQSWSGLKLVVPLANR